MKEKNNTIEFWRYFFTVMICLLHFEATYYPDESRRIFSCGYLGVEFFFILSGFLMMHSTTVLMEKKPQLIASSEAYKYTIKKYIKFLPYLAFSWVLLITTRAILFHYNFKELLMEIYKYFWEYVCLNATTVTWEILNGPTWYLSALLIVGFFIYYLQLKNKDLYIGFIAPFCVLLIYAYYASLSQGLDFHLHYAKFLNGAINRAIAGLSLGSIVYYLYGKLAVRGGFKKEHLLAANLVEIISIISCFALMINNKKGNNNFILLFPFSAIILLSALQVTYISKFLNNKFSRVLGKGSLVMYLNQAFFIGFYIRHWKTDYFKRDSLLFVICLTVLALLVQMFIDFARHRKVDKTFKVFRP